MRLCVLDTDHLSLLQRGHSQVAAKVLATPPEFLAIRIAATVRALNAALITRNHTDFSQVPGLLIEDWSRS